MKTICKRIRELLATDGARALRGDREAEEHLVDCPHCLELLESMAALDEAFAAMPAVDVPDEVVESLLARHELLPGSQEEQPADERWWSTWWAVAGEQIDRIRAARIRWGVVAVPAVLVIGLVGLVSVPMMRRDAERGPEPRINAVRVVKLGEPEESPKDLAEQEWEGKELADQDAADNPASPVTEPGASAAEPQRIRERVFRDEKVIEETVFFGDGTSAIEQGFGDEAATPAVEVTASAPIVDVSAAMRVAPESSVDSETEKVRRQVEMAPRDDRLEQNAPAEIGNREYQRKLSALEREADELDTLGKKNEAAQLRGRLDDQVKGLGEESGGRKAKADEGKVGGLGFANVDDSGVARRFLAEREVIDGIDFQEARGYWANTYVPGDRELRRLAASLAAGDRSRLESLAGESLDLHDASMLSPQPFDAPEGAALAVYLRADRRGLDSRQRLLLEVGLKGTGRRSGSRPAMNVGVVLDLRGEVSNETVATMRALVEALSGAHDLGDRFSLVVAGRPGGLVVPAERFRHGPLMVAMDDVFAAEKSEGSGLDLATAVQTAIETAAAEDDPDTTLGSSVVLLVSAQSIGGSLHGIVGLAHTSAVAGVPLSVVGIGTGVRLDELDRLVLAGQGNRRLLASPVGAAAVVERELEAVSRVIARALRLRIRLAAGVQLVDVIGSHRLDETRAQQVRDAENAVDRRLARNLGITADRGLDEEGIQVVIPAFYADDEHVILLDLVAPGPGPIADVNVRYKDLVWLRNGVTSTHLSLGRDRAAPGPLQLNVLKNLLSRRLGETLEQAADQVSRSLIQQALAGLEDSRRLLLELPLALPELAGDQDLAVQLDMLDEYIAVLGTGADLLQPDREQLVDSLRYAGRLQIISHPITTSN